MMASLLEMGNDAEKYENHCLVKHYLIVHPRNPFMHVTEKKKLSKRCLAAIFDVGWLFCMIKSLSALIGS